VHNLLRTRLPFYYDWSTYPKTPTIHRVGVLGFLVSFLFFTLLQFAIPNLFIPEVKPVLAGANSVTWSSYNEFTNNGVAGSNYTGATTPSQVAINDSANPTDANLGNVKLTDAFGTGADCDVTIGDGSTATSVNIKNLYEDVSVTRVTLANCTDSAKNGSNKGLNYGASSYLATASATPNFRSLTITANATLTTTGPSGSIPGVKIQFLVKNTLSIDATGKINVSGMGYGGGYGSGVGGTGGTSGGAGNGTIGSGGGGGGGYGGNGGNGGNGNRLGGGANGSGGGGGSIYNYQTSQFGSGGGKGYTVSGGAGGGAIKIWANDLVISGNILADGGNGGNGNRLGGGANGSGGGGGSGGSISIYSSGGIIDASKLSAKAGNGGNSNAYSGQGYGGGGGGGGGGKVILEIQAELISGNPVVNGGNGGTSGGGTAQPGSSGVTTSPSYQQINSVPFISPGTISGLKMQASSGQIYKWSSITWNTTTLPANTSISFQARTSNDGSSWSSWSTASTPQTSGITGTQDISSLGASLWLEIQMSLATSDGASTPTLNDFTVNYNYLNTSTSSKTYRNDNGQEINVANSNNYTNELSAIFKASIQPRPDSSPLMPQLEVRTDASFT